MAAAAPATVLGDFASASLSYFGATSRMFRKDDGFYVTTEGPGGRAATYRIAYTLGVHPLQQYMVEFDKGRIQVLPIAWDTVRQRWFHLYPEKHIEPESWLHWTNQAMTWNFMCADCHSTNLQKNYDAASDTYGTVYSEIDVSCEACHGPASEHVRAMRGSRDASGRAAGKGKKKAADGLVAFGEDAPRLEIETCAPCHARRHSIYPGYVPGRAFLDYYGLDLLDTELYYADGQVREEVYVYGSFVQSAMFRKGVRCTDCHDPHSLAPKRSGNSLCTRCHEPTRYDLPVHHHHAKGSAGARCLECHMPARLFMIVDPRRDHSFKVPRPDLTVDLGVPNPCNGCHRERTAAWARRKVQQWYGMRAPGLRTARAIAAGRRGDRTGQGALIEVAGRHPAGIVRASALALLGRYHGGPARAALRAGISDGDPLARAAAAHALRASGEPELARLLAPLLKDPVRLVRIEAVRALSGLRPETLPEASRQAFARAMAEYERGLAANRDGSAANVNLAILAARRGALDLAEHYYHRALAINQRYVPALLNLAMLYNRKGKYAEAEEHLRRLIAADPEMAEGHFALGLLLAHDPGRLGEALPFLQKAIDLVPENGTMRYNLGLAFQHLGRLREAEQALAAAYEREPTSAKFAYALAILYAQTGRWGRARDLAAVLVRLQPGNPRYAALLGYLREMAGQHER